ncbi:hypothetical protein RhiirC2_857899 [Rhizophagus irregularis]|uniref:Uncharacterized protein n=1 Tax=Rhizophagus irregularis TaxID=588596 RepID=A0A2N1M978_9GLOM|nr:hypothetical protein RhiirC2_857899 [Rhizophagus irregularis]
MTESFDFDYYPLAIAFKIVGKSRSVKQYKELAIEYKKFINSLDLTNNIKQKIINNIYNNWISDNRIKTVVNFVEKLYGLKLNRENITERSGETSFEASLSTLFDAQSIEQKNQSKHISLDKLRRLNLESLYDGSFVKMDDNIIEKLYPFYQKFASNKECIISAKNKNKLIYEGDTHMAYNEILRLFELQDPFRPELNNKHDFNAIGAPPKPSAKPRKPAQILYNSF